MHIAILTGGTSTERSIALHSGDNMKNWCITAGYSVDIFDFPVDIDQFLILYKKYDLIIPIFHGIYGEDGQITAFLKTLQCHYAYSPFTTHALCLDKYRTNLFIEKMGIKIPETFFIENPTNGTNFPVLSSFPLIVKPNRGGSSLSTSKVGNMEELQNACEAIRNDDILIQEYIPGREFTVGVYRDETGYHTLPIIEIKTIKEIFFDFSEKYETDGSNEVFLVDEPDLQKTLKEESENIAKLLHCSGVVRIDYRYNGSHLYFLEVNTIPGFTSGSLVPKMWKKAGKTEKEFVEMLNI